MGYSYYYAHSPCVIAETYIKIKTLLEGRITHWLINNYYIFTKTSRCSTTIAPDGVAPKFDFQSPYGCRPVYVGAGFIHAFGIFHSEKRRVRELINNAQCCLAVVQVKRKDHSLHPITGKLTKYVVWLRHSIRYYMDNIICSRPMVLLVGI